ncbi:MAG: hypothetical protein JOZ85_17560, partial [Betaproteobacteria bacterium]|nr:hypothetical protein [Betaproteobacteria bacterium]
SFFSTERRHYDVVISEPSNPWVSGVSSLFTREFYRRVRPHLNPGGLLVQWFQLYEIDSSLVSTVLNALGAEFPHYAIYAASDHDFLILASDAPLPAQADARVFEQPGLAKELWTIHVLNAGDIDARYVGNRATLEPLFASYGMPVNSDFYPVLDLNAARERFMDMNAAELAALGSLGVPVLELLEPSRPRRAPNPLFSGAGDFARLDHTRLAWYARNFLLDGPTSEAEPVTTRALQKDLELFKLRVIECREPRDNDVWLHSALQVAKTINPYLSSDDAVPVWARVQAGRCYPGLYDFQRGWILLFRAVAARDARRIADLATALLDSQRDAGIDARDYLLQAAMAADIALGRRDAALKAWQMHGERSRKKGEAAFRLLRCHARSEDCAADFAQAAR